MRRKLLHRRDVRLLEETVPQGCRPIPCQVVACLIPCSPAVRWASSYLPDVVASSCNMPFAGQPMVEREAGGIGKRVTDQADKFVGASRRQANRRTGKPSGDRDVRQVSGARVVLG